MVVNIKGSKKYKLIVYVKQKISNHIVIIYEKKIASNNSSDISGNNTIIGYSHVSGPNTYEQL